MSEISVISNQYDKLVSTSDKVNNSVVTFKKSSLLRDKSNTVKYPKLTVSVEEIERAKNILVPFLTNIQNLLNEDAQESEFIPALILEDYKSRLAKNQFLAEDLNGLINKMTSNNSIASEDIVVLDDILAILDTERSTLFRKLRTARG
ncbi:MAG: hypothetical protein H7Y13_03790 [Sphingobacteriaceae bacterium]|nr:hypothetical protein [Sphingobacteriaceae bacterium]